VTGGSGRERESAKVREDAKLGRLSDAGFMHVMDATTILREVRTWPVEERLRLVEALWDEMVDEGFEFELTEAQKAELDRRIAEADAHPERAIPWEEVQAYLKRPR